MFQNRATSEELGVLASRETCKEPEHRLMLAVLEEALATFHRGLDSSVAVYRKDFFKVLQWIRSPECDWLFSFENICATLQLDADYLRSGLATLRRNALVQRTVVKRRKVRRERIYDRHGWRGQIG